MALVKFGKLLLVVCAFLFSAPAALLASTESPPPATTSFAYSISHAVMPLPDSVIERIADHDGSAMDADDSGALEFLTDPPVDIRVGPPRALSRNGLCSAVVSVARANNLPIPFFANLIWHESSFNTKTISRAGAQGIAQFMPKTAVEFGLINPFEPIHALNVAGKFVRELHGQFGNLGLAAAAYNAGPRRVINWMAKRGELPNETRNYVLRITGSPAETWASPQAATDPEILLMPAKAPCVEVAEAVKVQTQLVRISKLMTELAQATTPMPRETPNEVNVAKADAKQTLAEKRRKGHSARVAMAARKGIGDDEASSVRRTRADKSAGKAARDNKKAAKEVSAAGPARIAMKEAAKEPPKVAIREKESAKEVAAKAAAPRPHRAARRTKFAYSPADRIHW